MKEIKIAFDIDGTLLSNEGIEQDETQHGFMRPPSGLNLEAVQLLQLLSHLKNVKIIVWSGGGKEYAEGIVRRYGLTKYVDKVYGKPVGTYGLKTIDGAYDESLYGKVDICFDDIHETKLADKNLIVKMK